MTIFSINIIAFQCITTQLENITTNAVTKSEFQVSNFINDFHKVSNENIAINVGIIKLKIQNKILFKRGDSQRIKMGFKGYHLLRSHWHFKFNHRLVNVVLLPCCTRCFVNMKFHVISIETDSMMRRLRCHEPIIKTIGIVVISIVEYSVTV